MVRVSLFVLLAAMAAGSPALADGRTAQLGLNWTSGGNSNTIVIVLVPPVYGDGNGDGRQARDEPRRPRSSGLGVTPGYYRCNYGVCANY